MELICPSCQKRLTIEDRFAGMVVRCPLCNGMLQAPVLLNAPGAPPAAPVPPQPVADPPAPVSSSPAPATMPDLTIPSPAAAPSSPAAVTTPPVLDAAEIVSPPAESPAIRLGEYTKSLRCHLRPDILEWIAPGCVVAIFLLSLFAWYYHEAYGLNLWELAFTSRGHAIYTFYTVVFMFLGVPVTAVTLVFEKCWLPLPEVLRPYWRFRSLLVGGVLALPFVFLLCDYIQFQFLPFGMQAAISMKLAVRIHLVAVVACALQFWLEIRRTTNAPMPRLTIRW